MATERIATVKIYLYADKHNTMFIQKGGKNSMVSHLKDSDEKIGAAVRKVLNKEVEKWEDR